MMPEQLRDWRMDHGMTQELLATYLGVRANTIARWERGVLKIPGMLSLALRALQRGEEDVAAAVAGREAVAEDEEEDAPSQDMGLALSITPERMRQLLHLCHPDKHGNSQTSKDVTQWLLELRRAGASL